MWGLVGRLEGPAEHEEEVQERLDVGLIRCYACICGRDAGRYSAWAEDQYTIRNLEFEERIRKRLGIFAAGLKETWECLRRLLGLSQLFELAQRSETGKESLRRLDFWQTVGLVERKEIWKGSLRS